MIVYRTFALLLVLGLAAAPAQAGITFVGNSAPTQSASSVTSITVTAPSGITTNDVLVVWLTVNAGTTTITAPSGWTGVQQQIAPVVGLFWKAATAADVGGTTTYSFTLSASKVAAANIMAFRGVSTTNPIVTSAWKTVDSTVNHTDPSITPGVANTMLIAAFGSSNGQADTMSVPSGMTQAYYGATGNGGSGVEIEVFYELLSAATATPTETTTSGSSLSATTNGGSFALQPATASLPTITALYHLDETSWSGTPGEVLDSSGNGYNGVAVGGATTSGTTPAISGTPGTCNYGTFNGTSQYVSLSSLPQPGTTFSMTAWIYPTNTTTTSSRIFGDDVAGAGWDLGYGDLGAGKLLVIIRQPNTVLLPTTYGLTANTWYFVVVTLDAVTAKSMSLYLYSQSGTLLYSTSTGISGFTPTGGSYQAIGGGSYVPAIFPGNIDEVIFYAGALTQAQATSLALATHACPTVPNHYDVVNAGTAVNCAPTPVTIYAHTATHTVLSTTDTITLGTSTGHGDWTLTTGSGTFAAGASNSGAATYTYSVADAGTAVFALRDTYAETVTINVTDGPVTATSGTALASEDAPLVFKASGFIITNGSNVATTIGTQVAGVTSTQSLALQAVRTDTNTGACTAVFASGSTVNIGLAYQCNNPTSCVSGQTLKLTNNGTATALASNPNSAVTTYTTVPLKFSTANAEAPFSLVYSDAGQISLDAKYTIPLGNGSSSGSTMLGAAQFVVQPYTLQLSNIMRTSNSFANPAASTATGTVFMPAGQPFTATVTALNYLGAATPNFGRETSPAAVTMTTNQVLATAVGGSDFPAISGSFGSYTAGAATGTAFSWPEVGIMTITPAVSSYLGSGTVTGTTTGNVGRFIPNNFSVALNTPLFATACSAGGFTYLGQPFTYYVAPVITVTAQSLGGTTTLNYTGSLFRLTNASLTSRTYTTTPSSPTLTTTGLPPTSSDPTIASSGNGVGTLTFSAGTGLSFTRGTPIAPLSANIALSINIIDLDSAAATTNPVTFGASSGIQFNTGNYQYYGRLALPDALGSELLDLPMSLTTQYYVSATTGFATNTVDSCTTAPAIAFSNYLLNLTKACVQDTGSPGVSGAGCTAAGAASEKYYAQAVAGGFNLWLAAPGSGNNGAVTVTATAPAWLQYLWNAGSGVNSNPSANASFGVFPGPRSRIYQREVY